MNADLEHRVSVQGGVILTRDARACGYDDRSIARELAQGRWHRLRRGAYISIDSWRDADDTARHRILARAVQLQASGQVALTHTTGAAALGLDQWRPDLRRVHLTHLGTQSGRIEYGVDHHEGPLDIGQCVTVDGLLVGPPAIVVAGAMMLSDSDGAVVVGDAALRTNVVDPAALEAVGAEWMRVPDTRSLRWAIPRLDARAANPAESLMRVRIRRAVLPRPELQYEIRDGDFVAYADFAWPDRMVIGEFDGKRKYLRDLRPGEDPGEVVYREKVRKDRLRALGWTVIRVTWPELFAFDPVAERFRRALYGPRLGRTLLPAPA